jgi:hypothetical protein
MIETILQVLAVAVIGFVVLGLATPFDINISDGPESDDEGDPQ